MAKFGVTTDLIKKDLGEPDPQVIEWRQLAHKGPDVKSNDASTSGPKG